MKEDNLHVHILSVLVKEVLEEVRHRLIRDVATHNDVPENVTSQLIKVYPALYLANKHRTVSPQSLRGLN